jgi:Uncharacterised protein family (UPF0236)
MTLTEQIINTLSTWQKQLLQLPPAADATSLALLEQAAGDLGKRIAGLALADQLQQLGSGYESSSRPCPCGQRQRFVRYSARHLRSLCGPLRLRRAYYHCSHCGTGSAPLDAQLGLSERDITPGVERAASLLAAHLPFAETEFVLQELTGVVLSGRQIETVAEALGQQAEARQQAEQQVAAQQALPEISGPQRQPPKTFVVEMDGVQVGLQNGSFQEVKCGVIYELRQRVEIREQRWELLSSRRLAWRGEVSTFRQRLWANVLALGVRPCDRLVVLGDGAEWIDQTAQFLFPGALRILDYYHAAERLWAVARARFGDGSSEGEKWARRQAAQLKGGLVKRVIASLQRLRMKRVEAQRLRDEAVRYLRARCEQMKYDAYESQGLPIGSGAVESTCKQIVTARLKQAGMRWSEAGVDAMVALRCYVLNRRFDELCRKPEITFDWRQAA